MSKLRYVSLIIFAYAVFAAPQEMPQELTWPRETEERDSSALQFSSDQFMFDKSFTSTNNLLYRTNAGPIYVEQGAWYELHNDKLSNTRHYLNASGSFNRELTTHSWITPGLDWTPVTQYSTNKNSNNALTTIDIGPTLGLNLNGVPLNLRAGMLGRRADSLSSWKKIDNSRSNVGAYGSFKAGSEEELLPFAPVYFYANGTGRQIENSAMASLTGSALGALRIGEQDSVFIYGGTSLFNGREGYLEESADSRAMLFANTPWRIEQNVAFSAGFKAAQRHIFNPSTFYRFTENKLKFPDDSRKRDERTVSQILGGALFTDTTAPIYYSGSLSFEWQDHDKLFGKEFSTTATQDNIDSLEVKLWDYAAFNPATAHLFTVRLPRSLKLKYGITLNRFLTEYPNFYVKEKDTVTNKDDSDRRTQQQKLTLEFNNDSSLKAEIYGELIDYTLVFLKRARSGANRTDKTQRVGFLVEWSPANELLVSEAVTAEAKKGDFHFPAFHQDVHQRPRFSRALSSASAALWQFTSYTGLKGEWSIKYSDYGFWYGRAYMEDALTENKDVKTDFYAITSKSIYYTIDIAVQLRLSQNMWEIGNVFTDARDRNFSGGSYVKTSYSGYTAKPYFNALAQLGENVNLAAMLSHTFVKDPNTSGYWDLRLQMEGRF
ncbi:MAG: hypothetical protein LBB56_05320 [Chitinispirillales bacterium]|jgi:hypothetical protein|nr:hypothetical protein [Chitinispirillales bacterium]